MIKLPTPPTEGGNFLDWAEEVQAYLQATQPRSSADLLLDSTPGGTGFKFRRKVHIPPRRLHPFESQIVGETRNSSDECESVTVRLNPNSTLIASQAWTDSFPIDGLLDDWTMDRFSVLFLKNRFQDSDGALLDASIECLPMDDMPTYGPYPAWPAMRETSHHPYVAGEYFWWQLLAYFRPSREGERRDIKKFVGHDDPHTLINTQREHLMWIPVIGSSQDIPLVYWAGAYESE
jgi:hypothetical protein